MLVLGFVEFYLIDLKKKYTEKFALFETNIQICYISKSPIIDFKIIQLHLLEVIKKYCLKVRNKSKLNYTQTDLIGYTVDDVCEKFDQLFKLQGE